MWCRLPSDVQDEAIPLILGGGDVMVVRQSSELPRTRILLLRIVGPDHAACQVVPAFRSLLLRFAGC